MKELLEQGGGFVFIGIVAGVGMLVRVLLFAYYTVLVRACREPGTTKNRTLVYIREELNRRERENLGIKSAAVYTEYRLAECKVCGIRLGILEGIAEQSVFLVMLGGVLVALAGVLWGSNTRSILLGLFVSGVTVLIMLMADLTTGLREKHKRIRLCIRDYIENSPALFGENISNVLPAVNNEKAEKKEERSRKNEAKREAKKEKKEVRNLRRDKPIVQTRKKNGKAQEEKRRLTEELLRERRQMEARHLAERREKEQKAVPELVVQESRDVLSKIMPKEAEETVKTPVQQAAEEAAATTISYETLLREVLAEYLA